MSYSIHNRKTEGLLLYAFLSVYVVRCFLDLVALLFVHTNVEKNYTRYVRIINYKYVHTKRKYEYTGYHVCITYICTRIPLLYDKKS